MQLAAKTSKQIENVRIVRDNFKTNSQANLLMEYLVGRLISINRSFDSLPMATDCKRLQQQLHQWKSKSSGPSDLN